MFTVSYILDISSPQHIDIALIFLNNWIVFCGSCIDQGPKRYTQLGFLNGTIYRGVVRRMLRHPDASKRRKLFPPQIWRGGGTEQLLGPNESKRRTAWQGLWCRRTQPWPEQQWSREAAGELIFQPFPPPPSYLLPGPPISQTQLQTREQGSLEMYYWVHWVWSGGSK